MPRKRDSYGRVVFSDKQKAVLLYGQRLRGLGNVGELQRHLNELGYQSLANEVKRAAEVLKAVAKQEYKDSRLALDPDWKDPVELYREQVKQEEELRWQSQLSKD